MVQTVEFTLPELLERLHAGQIPVNAKVSVTYDDAATAAMPAPTDPTLLLFAQWAEEDAQTTPEQQAENARIYDEIERNGIPRVQV